jgi:hypothetical protein
MTLMLLDSSPFFCSTNHLQLSTYCLPYIRLPKTHNHHALTKATAMFAGMLTEFYHSTHTTLKSQRRMLNSSRKNPRTRDDSLMKHHHCCMVDVIGSQSTAAAVYEQSGLQHRDGHSYATTQQHTGTAITFTVYNHAPFLTKLKDCSFRNLEDCQHHFPCCWIKPVLCYNMEF